MAATVFMALSMPFHIHAQGGDSLTASALKELDVPFFDGNEAVLLPTGRMLFDDMLGIVEKAERYVHMEFYNFRNDSIGNATFDLLKKKASQGVEVKVLFDGFGNFTSSLPFTKEEQADLRKHGVRIYEFDPYRFPYINHSYHRDHRKIVTVDGHTAYTGGMNVGDYYIHGRPSIGKWRDMHMRIHGPAVAEFERLFSEMWKKVTGEETDSTRYAGPNTSRGNVRIGVVNRKPGRRSGIMRKAYAAAIDNAQHSIQIVNAYPTLTRTVRRSLYRALKRGVQVDFMVSANSDEALTPSIVAIEMKKLMKRGANVYYFEGGFHHSKVMTVDGSYCTVGSANLDARSLMFDYEANAFMFDPVVTNQLYDIFEFDKRAFCTRLTPEDFKNRFPLSQRLQGRMLFFLKPFL